MDCVGLGRGGPRWLHRASSWNLAAVSEFSELVRVRFDCPTQRARDKRKPRSMSRGFFVYASPLTLELLELKVSLETGRQCLRRVAACQPTFACLGDEKPRLYRRRGFLLEPHPPVTSLLAKVRPPDVSPSRRRTSKTFEPRLVSASGAFSCKKPGLAHEETGFLSAAVGECARHLGSSTRDWIECSRGSGHHIDGGRVTIS